LGGLKERSRAPKSIPHKIPEEEEKRIIAMKEEVSILGSRKERFNLPYSTKTIKTDL
jgi:hypothetical protein